MNQTMNRVRDITLSSLVRRTIQNSQCTVPAQEVQQVQGMQPTANRGSNPTKIVQPYELLTDQQILNEEWDLISLNSETYNVDQCLHWLAKHRLIMNSCICIGCNQPATFNKYTQAIDGCCWKCYRCNIRKSVRWGSFFDRSKLPMCQIILLVYCWCKNYPLTIITDETKISPNSVVEWCNFCRLECEKWKDMHINGIGGIDENFEPISVEIAVHDRLGRWVFGGIERLMDGSGKKCGKCFLVTVPDRSEATLQAEMVRHILPGTHVISDGWSSFGDISLVADGIYTHTCLQHGFIDREDGELHTQTINNMWMRIRKKLKRQSGTSQELFDSYLDEFVFRNTVRAGNVFGIFLRALAENYQL